LGKINWNKPESVWNELKSNRGQDWVGQQIAKTNSKKVKRILEQIDLDKCNERELEFIESIHTQVNYKYFKLSEKQIKWLQIIAKK